MISAAMFVKDEAKRIWAALNSLVGLVDEVVIIDTGSTDRTVPLIQEFAGLDAVPTRLYHREWQNDFGDMRNQVQALCEGSWIFILDGDEVVTDHGNMRERMLNTTREALGARIEAEMDSGQTDCHDAIRAYRKDACHWQYPIHNQLMGFKSAEPTSCVIRSYYVGTLKDKLARSVPMLEKYGAEHPFDPHAPFFLAKSYRAIADWPNVRKWCEVCRKLVPSEPAYAIFWIWLHEAISLTESLEAAHPVAEEALAYHPKYGELWHKRLTHDALSWATFIQNKGSYVFQSDVTGKFVENLPEASKLLGLPLEFRKGVVE